MICSGLETTPRSAAESATRDSGRASAGDDDSAEDDDDLSGPRRRRLSAKQYEALVRCAQQVVAVSAVPPAPMPHAAAPVIAAAPARSFNANHSSVPVRSAEVKQHFLVDSEPNVTAAWAPA